MLFGLFSKKQGTEAIQSLYATIVAQARRPEFYARLHVPDTMDGRLEMIMLHVVLFSYRLKTENEADRLLSQGVFDRFCEDMDGNYREQGIADTRVPKKMKAIGQSFYGHVLVYDKALAAQDADALAKALARNIYGNEGHDAHPLARYVMASAQTLQRQDMTAFHAGTLHFASIQD